jgi:hypothetical protein
VGGGQRLQALLPRLGQAPNRPGAVPVRMALDQTGGLRPVDQLHRAMVAQEQIPGGFADCRPLRIGVPADSQQQLMLCRREPGPCGLFGAPAEKPAQPSPKAQETLVLCGRVLASSRLYRPARRQAARR